MFNARAETVSAKPSSLEAWRQRPALLACSGWYEWEDKQPHYVHRSDGKPVVLAALWQDDTFTVLTTAAGADLEWLHHRVPVVLSSRHRDGWLRGEGRGVDGDFLNGPAGHAGGEPLGGQRAEKRAGVARGSVAPFFRGRFAV